MDQTLYATTAPLGTKTGDLPSGPPPTGRIVSVVAKRAFEGTTGWIRSAGIVSISDRLLRRKTYIHSCSI